MLANRERRSGLTDWERAAEDLDRAEWALPSKALDAGNAGRVREADDRLARCQQRAGRLRPGPGSTSPRDADKPCRDRPTGRRAPGGA